MPPSRVSVTSYVSLSSCTRRLGRLGRASAGDMGATSCAPVYVSKSIRFFDPNHRSCHSRAASPALDDRRAQRRACFIVRDKTGQPLAYIYFEDEPGLAIDQSREIIAVAETLTKEPEYFFESDPTIWIFWPGWRELKFCQDAGCV